MKDAVPAQASDGTALLWERGRYLHADRAIAPESFVQEVQDWVLAVFKQERIPFMSCSRPFLKFAQQCGSYSIASEYALCSLLKRLPKSSTSFLVIEKAFCNIFHNSLL